MQQTNEEEYESLKAECWKIAWYREPVCHPNERYSKMMNDKKG